MAASDAAGAPAPSGSHRDAIQALEARLAALSKATQPFEYARVAYRLGLAHAESPVGAPADGYRRALAYFDVAAGIFDPKFDPVEHARILNAAGAAHRALGDQPRAAGLFEKAAELFTGHARDQELAAALNNLGLVRSEMADPKSAVEAFDKALDLFDTATPEGRRGLVATLHNRGQAHAALGTEEGLEAALDDYRTALTALGDDDAPYHRGLVHHSSGVAASTLAARRSRPDDDSVAAQERQRLLDQAIDDFGESLNVFVRTGFPFQHALAKHNMGLAYAAKAGGVSDLRHALACFEDAVAVLDPRAQADAWRQSFNSMTRVEDELAARVPGAGRAAHFAALVGSARPDERHSLLAQRLLRLRDLPDGPRHSALVELALASAQLPPEQAQRFMEAELKVVMELPNEVVDGSLRARYEGHCLLADEEAREAADRALDTAIGEALGMTQRIYVRDFLYELGWERP